MSVFKTEQKKISQEASKRLKPNYFWMLFGIQALHKTIIFYTRIKDL